MAQRGVRVVVQHRSCYRYPRPALLGRILFFCGKLDLMPVSCESY